LLDHSISYILFRPSQKVGRNALDSSSFLQENKERDEACNAAAAAAAVCFIGAREDASNDGIKVASGRRRHSPTIAIFFSFSSSALSLLDPASIHRRPGRGRRGRISGSVTLVSGGSSRRRRELISIGKRGWNQNSNVEKNYQPPQQQQQHHPLSRHSTPPHHHPGPPRLPERRPGPGRSRHRRRPGLRRRRSPRPGRAAAARPVGPGVRSGVC